MCWLTNACPSTTSATAFFRSAPSAVSAAHREAAPRPGRVSAGTAQYHGPESAGASHGVVDAPRDRPFADEERVRDPAQPRQRIGIFIGNRLARTIRAGHHQHFGSARREEQMMQRRVRQHHAEFVVSRVPRSAKPISPAPEQLAARRKSAALPLAAQLDQLRAPYPISRHHREWLLLAILPFPQSRYGRRVSRIARQVVAANALYRDNRARRNSAACECSRRFPARPSPIANQYAARTQARHRLRVKSPVRGIAVLLRAIARAATRHGRVGPVIGQPRMTEYRGPQFVQLIYG